MKLLCQKLPAEIEEKLWHWTSQNKRRIILIQTGTVDENPLYFLSCQIILAMSGKNLL
jgi:hypothetical protein